MKRHAPRLSEGAGRDSGRVTRLDQWTDGEAHFVRAIGFEQRTEQRGAAFAQHLP